MSRGTGPSSPEPLALVPSSPRFHGAVSWQHKARPPARAGSRRGRAGAAPAPSRCRWRRRRRDQAPAGGVRSVQPSPGGTGAAARQPGPGPGRRGRAAASLPAGPGGGGGNRAGAVDRIPCIALAPWEPRPEGPTHGGRAGGGRGRSPAGPGRRRGRRGLGRGRAALGGAPAGGRCGACAERGDLGLRVGPGQARLGCALSPPVPRPAEPALIGGQHVPVHEGWRARGPHVRNVSVTPRPLVGGVCRGGWGRQCQTTRLGCRLLASSGLGAQAWGMMDPLELCWLMSRLHQPFFPSCRDPFAIHRQHMNRMLSGSFGFSPFLSITDGTMPGARQAGRRMQVKGYQVPLWSPSTPSPLPKPCF